MVEEAAIRALAGLIQPAAQSLSKKLIEGDGGNDPSEALINALMQKYAGVIEQTDPAEIASRMLRKQEKINIRKQLNLENVFQLALELANDVPEEQRRAIDEDWFFQWYSAIEDVSDSRVQELWARAFAQRADENKAIISLRALDTLRLMQFEDVARFVRFVELTQRFGLIFATDYPVFDATMSASDLDTLIDLNLTIREENKYQNLPIAHGLAVIWTLPPDKIRGDPIWTYRLSARGKELSGTIPNFDEPMPRGPDQIDVNNPLAAAHYANAIALGFEPPYEIYLNYYENRVQNPGDRPAERSREHVRSHKWNAKTKRWDRLVELRPSPLTEVIMALERGALPA